MEDNVFITVEKVVTEEIQLHAGMVFGKDEPSMVLIIVESGAYSLVPVQSGWCKESFTTRSAGEIKNFIENGNYKYKGEIFDFSLTKKR